MFGIIVSTPDHCYMKDNALTQMLTRSIQKETGKTAPVKSFKQVRSMESGKHQTKVSLPSGMDCAIIGTWFYPVVAITKYLQPIGFDSVAQMDARLAGCSVDFVYGIATI